MLREADYEVVDFGDSQLIPNEEVRPLLDAKPTPGSTKLSRHRTIMTPDLEHLRQSQEPCVHAARGMSATGKGAPLASPENGKREDTP